LAASTDCLIVETVMAYGAVMKVLCLCLLVATTAWCQVPQPVAVRHLVAPAYPRLAREAQIQGSVRVEIEINPPGKVVRARASGPDKLLERAAEKNIRKWIFAATAPGELSGLTRLTVTYVYVLKGKEEYRDPLPEVVFDLPDQVTITSHPPEPQPQRVRRSPRMRPVLVPPF
jgi:TonB family protein